METTATGYQRVNKLTGKMQACRLDGSFVTDPNSNKSKRKEQEAQANKGALANAQ
jgi:hypothetical protein